MPRAFAEVTFAGQRFFPRSSLVIQAEYAHDVCTFVLSTAESPSVREGDPLMLIWGQEHGDTQTFYGYVHHVEPYYEGAGGQEWLKFVGIGATYLMRQGLQQSWHAQTADVMVREVVNNAYLSVDAEPSAIAWPYVTATDSGWKFLQDMATLVGYTLAGNGTEVRFMSQTTAIRRSAPGAPVLVLNSNLKTFRPVVGSPTTGGSRAVRVGQGIDPRTGLMFSVTDAGQALPVMGPDTMAPAFAQFLPDITGTTPEELAGRLSGLTRQNRLDYLADAEAIGNPQVVQASVVYVIGVGTDYEGHWYVQQVEHEVRATAYTMYLKLARDARQSFPPTVGLVPVLRTDPFGVLSSASPPALLSNGTWRSGWARRPG